MRVLERTMREELESVFWGMGGQVGGLHP
jgi:hypothetical protein